MLTFTDENLRKRLLEKYDADAAGLNFYSFPDLEANVKNQVDNIKSTPFLPKDIPVYGFVYDVRTGKIKEVARATATTAPEGIQEQEEVNQDEEEGQKIRKRISVSTNA
ncbi:MAG: hypothetical protein JO297_16305 [Nitrososphaeraceae archaeon]|nr:hypothetical protein [Nitrososphaeraceae archaeon]